MSIEWKDYFWGFAWCGGLFDSWLRWGGIWLWPKLRLSSHFDCGEPPFILAGLLVVGVASCQADGLGLDGDQYLALYSQYA